MEIKEKNGYREIVASDGKYLNRKGTDTYCKRCIMLPNDTEDSFVEVDNTPDSEVEQARSTKLEEITDYDTSSSVNSFTLNDEEVWLDKSTRVGLMNSTQIEKAAGNETTTLWFDGKSYTLSCDVAIQMLSALELYALKCYNVTAQHKANVMALTTKEEIETYDYKTGYPEKLNLNTNNS